MRSGSSISAFRRRLLAFPGIDGQEVAAFVVVSSRRRDWVHPADDSYGFEVISAVQMPLPLALSCRERQHALAVQRWLGHLSQFPKGLQDSVSLEFANDLWSFFWEFKDAEAVVSHFAYLYDSSYTSGVLLSRYCRMERNVLQGELYSRKASTGHLYAAFCELLRLGVFEFERPVHRGAFRSLLSVSSRKKTWLPFIFYIFHLHLRSIVFQDSCHGNHARELLADLYSSLSSIHAVESSQRTLFVVRHPVEMLVELLAMIRNGECANEVPERIKVAWESCLRNSLNVK
jgi:hypothetical protein